MRSGPQPDNPTSSYTGVYDAWNRLVEVKDGSDTIASYEYNGLGWRVQADVDTDGDGTTDETRYVYYSRVWQRLEVRVDGTASADLDRHYVWGHRYIDALVCRDRDTDGDGTTDERLFALQGANFNVWATVDDTGAVQERFGYTPYGERSVQQGDFSADADMLSDDKFWIGTQGLYEGNTTRLVYNRVRMLNHSMGRFIRRDPLRYTDGPNVYAAYRVLRGTNDPLGSDDITVGVEGEAVGILGVACEGGAVFDTDNLWDSGIYVYGGLGVGLSAGGAVGAGWHPGEVEGACAQIDTNLLRGVPLSGELTVPKEGPPGFGIGVGPEVGISGDVGKTYTILTVGDVCNATTYVCAKAGDAANAVGEEIQDVWSLTCESISDASDYVW